MGMLNKKLAGLAIIGLLAAGPAGAVVTFGGGTNLQTQLDYITIESGGCTGDTYDGATDNCKFSTAAGDYLADGGDSYWNISASGGSVETIIFEFASLAGSNTFGIYDRADINNKLEIFGGAADETDQTTLSALTFGGGYLFSANGINEIFATRDFGYYLQGEGGTFFYSDTSLNSDTTQNNGDHMVAYAGNGDYLKYCGEETIMVGGVAVTDTVCREGVFGANEYILAWEDLYLDGTSDTDYSDFVVIVESVIPVPAPATLALLGLGLIGMGFRARRKTA